MYTVDFGVSVTLMTPAGDPKQQGGRWQGWLMCSALGIFLVSSHGELGNPTREVPSLLVSQRSDGTDSGSPSWWRKWLLNPGNVPPELLTALNAWLCDLACLLSEEGRGGAEHGGNRVCVWREVVKEVSGSSSWSKAIGGSERLAVGLRPHCMVDSFRKRHHLSRVSKCWLTRCEAEREGGDGHVSLAKGNGEEKRDWEIFQRHNRWN